MIKIEGERENPTSFIIFGDVVQNCTDSLIQLNPMYNTIRECVLVTLSNLCVFILLLACIMD